MWFCLSLYVVSTLTSDIPHSPWLVVSWSFYPWPYQHLHLNLTLYSSTGGQSLEFVSTPWSCRAMHSISKLFHELNWVLHGWETGCVIGPGAGGFCPVLETFRAGIDEDGRGKKKERCRE